MVRNKDKRDAEFNINNIRAFFMCVWESKLDKPIKTSKILT